MTLGNTIAQYRKSLNITQEALAQQLGITNQAVSKWESYQCCPDVMLLPKLADIFGITLDELFGRAVPVKEEAKTEPVVKENPLDEHVVSVKVEKVNEKRKIKLLLNNYEIIII